MKNQDGFTLIEIIIAMFILTFISIAIYNLTASTFKLRESLATEGDFMNGIRISMGIMQRDINLIYSPVLMKPSPTPKASGAPLPGNPPPGNAPDAQDMAVIMSSDLGQGSEFWSAATEKTGIRPSRFLGTDVKISFITLSHQRMYKDSPESEFAKVTYELRRDEGNREHPDTQMLVKIEDSDAFNMDESQDKNRRVFPLLHGIKKLSYRYSVKTKDTAARSWDTEAGDTKNIFPDVIEIDLTVVGPGGLTYDGVYKVRPEVPLRGLDPST